MNLQTVMGIVRHVLTFGGGYLVAKGVITEPGLTEAIAAIVSLGTIVWSALQKKGTVKA